jgi:hypothetical protein
MIITPFVAGAIGLAIFSAFSVQKSTSGIVSGSANLQQISSTFYRDVQSAQNITTDPTAPQCGTGTQLVGMEWGQANGYFNDLVSYSLNGSGSNGVLVRNYCSQGYNPTPTSTETVATNIPVQGTSVIVSPSRFTALTSVGWVSANGITNIRLSMDKSLGGIAYAFDSVPQLSSSSIAASAPGSPTNVTASTSNGTVTVTWTPPMTNGGSAITNYTVIATDLTATLSGGQECSTAATSCTVSGLTLGNTYTFAVVATNAAGSSNPSASSSPVIPSTVPLVVTGLSATGPNNSVQFTESWTAPSSGGLPLTDYEIRYSTDNATWTTINTNSTATSYTINPPSETTYYVQVAAMNADGLGPWSNSDTVSWVETTSYQVPNYGYSCPSGGSLSGSTCTVSSSYAASYVETGSYPIYTYEQTGSTPNYGYVQTGETPDYTYECTAYNNHYQCISYGYVLTGYTPTYTYEIVSYTAVYGDVQTGTGYDYGYVCESGGSLSGSTCYTSSSYAGTYGVVSYSTDWNYGFRG